MRNLKLSCQIEIDKGLFVPHKTGFKRGWRFNRAQKLHNIQVVAH